jgi:hypothetical protein
MMYDVAEITQKTRNSGWSVEENRNTASSRPVRRYVSKRRPVFCTIRCLLYRPAPQKPKEDIPLGSDGIDLEIASLFLEHINKGLIAVHLLLL